MMTANEINKTFHIIYNKDVETRIDMLIFNICDMMSHTQTFLCVDQYENLPPDNCPIELKPLLYNRRYIY